MKRLFISSVRAAGLGLLVGAIACTSPATSTYFDYCDPSIPADECYAIRRDPDSAQVAQALAIARRYIERNPSEEQDWDWRAGVWMFALTELYRITGEADLHDYYQTWLDHWIEQGYAHRLVWSDGCPPALTAIALLNDPSTDESKLADYQKVVDDVLGYLDEAPRTAEGGISHNGVVGQLSIWVDSLFMFGMVLNRWGDLADPARLDMMSEQVQIFAEGLQDDNGFMRHAKDWPGYDESVYWARGNSWVVASLSDYLRARVVQDAAGATDPEVEQVFRSQVRAIIGSQQPNGLWLSVMSHPEEPDNDLETSSSALFAYGIARAYRYGILGENELQVAKAAVQGIEQTIRSDADGPVVTGVSIATDPWPLQQYLDVPIEDDVNYGVGAVILALLETSGL